MYAWDIKFEVTFSEDVLTELDGCFIAEPRGKTVSMTVAADSAMKAIQIGIGIGQGRLPAIVENATDCSQQQMEKLVGSASLDVVTLARGNYISGIQK